MRANDNVIVIADDDPEMCDSLAATFASRGYTVHTCNDGLAAVALCKEVRPGVALIDLEMPGIDGYEVARRLRADIDLGTRLVAVTGRSDAQASALAWDAGFHDFLGKPAPVSMLLAMIRRTQEMQAIKSAR
jgi:DNA-binding response OmpR family regulator